jgi:hypothetical protein
MIGAIAIVLLCDLGIFAIGFSWGKKVGSSQKAGGKQ